MRVLQYFGQSQMSAKRTARVFQLLAMMCVLMLCFSAPLMADSVYYGSGGGGSGDTAAVVPAPTVISGEVTTEQDKELNAAMATSGTPTITLADNKNALADISPAMIQAISDNNLPMVVSNQGVSVEFEADALMTTTVTQAVGQSQATVQIGAKVVTADEKKTIMDAAKAGDSLAEEAVNRLANYLGWAIANINDIINPESFVIGGGLSYAGEFLMEKIQAEAIKRLTYPQYAVPEMVLARFKNEAGMIGAANLGSFI